MVSKLRSGVKILEEEGLLSLASRVTSYVRRETSRRYSELRYAPQLPATDLLAEDWDTLVVLDACRYDQFEELVELNGRLSFRTSPGSCTPEFLAANFEDETCHDTVYVTANPMYRRVGIGDTFHDVVDVWESDWDEDNQTVHPEKMVTATRAAHATYPDKRILAHFVQPHYPFIGEKGRALEASVGESFSGVEWIDQDTTDSSGEERNSPWDLLDEGLLDEAAVREAYDENLRLTVPYVRQLVDAVEGKVVVTSDHGNLLGERIAPFSGKTYGHPPETYTTALRKVPWFVVEGECRRDVRAEDPSPNREPSSAAVDERLAHLGYAQTQ